MKNIIPIATLLLLLGIMYLLIKHGKIMTMQTSLLIAMAGKLGVNLKEEKNLNQESQPEEKQEIMDEEEEDLIIVKEMTRISDMIKAKEKISEKDAKYYNHYINEMHEDLQLAPSEEILVFSKEDKKRLTADEKKVLILTFFDDAKAKTVNDVAKMLAKATGIKPNEGNTHTLLKSLIENKNLFTQELKHGGKKKVFYGLPDWFDGKKLKKEYLTI